MDCVLRGIVSRPDRSAHGGTPGERAIRARTYREGMRKRDRRTEAVYSVSGVQTSLTDDIKVRTRKYAISMAVRTACVLGAIVTEGPVRWTLFVGALILPYIAVVVANGGRETTRRDAPPPVVLPLRTQLPPLQREDPS